MIIGMRVEKTIAYKIMLTTTPNVNHPPLWELLNYEGNLRLILFPHQFSNEIVAYSSILERLFIVTVKGRE